MNNEVSENQQSEFGLKSGVTSYGDKDFALFLRKAFIKGAGCKSKTLPPT
jgi:dihydroxy-acid dehydratase